MKGHMLRPRPEQVMRHTMCLTPQARIVTSTLDATRDKFIPLEVARQRCIDGKLTEIDLGPDYPNAYMEV